MTGAILPLIQTSLTLLAVRVLSVYRHSILYKELSILPAVTVQYITTNYAPNACLNMYSLANVALYAFLNSIVSPLVGALAQLVARA